MTHFNKRLLSIKVSLHDELFFPVIIEWHVKKNKNDRTYQFIGQTHTYEFARNLINYHSYDILLIHRMS